MLVKFNFVHVKGRSCLNIVLTNYVSFFRIISYLACAFYFIFIEIKKWVKWKFKKENKERTSNADAWLACIKPFLNFKDIQLLLKLVNHQLAKSCPLPDTMLSAHFRHQGHVPTGMEVPSPFNEDTGKTLRGGRGFDL